MSRVGKPTVYIKQFSPCCYLHAAWSLAFGESQVTVALAMHLGVMTQTNFLAFDLYSQNYPRVSPDWTWYYLLSHPWPLSWLTLYVERSILSELCSWSSSFTNLSFWGWETSNREEKSNLYLSSLDCNRNITNSGWGKDPGLGTFSISWGEQQTM